MSDFAAKVDEEDDMDFLDAVEGPEEVEDGTTPSVSEVSHNMSNLELDTEKEINQEVDDSHSRSIDEALSAKEAGNTHFRDKEYHLALDMYSRAIYMCPLEDEHKGQMAIFYGNRSACYSSMCDWEMVIEDCTKALELNDTYVKVVMRRCQAYENLEKYDEAILDAKKLLEVDPHYPKACETLARLERLNAEKLEKMKNEALGKLKDLGNSILGNFGMSLDNFKMEQDKTTGSWNISFNMYLEVLLSYPLNGYLKDSQ